MRCAPRGQKVKLLRMLFGGLKLITLHFPFDAHQKIEVHAFGLQPSFERLTGFRAKLHKHLPFEHVDEYTFDARGAARLHALREGFRPLSREAGKRVLRKVARHENS